MATHHIAAWNQDVCLHPPASPRARLRRFGLILLVVSNVAAAGTAVYGARAVLTNPGSIVPFSNLSTAAAAENTEAVVAFYAAVNDAIRTGDAAPLDALVAPRMTWCLPCPDQAPDRDGLKRYVADLHQLFPEMRLVVDEVVGGLAETVTVRLHLSGYPLAGAASPWGPVDTLRLMHGQIVERRNGSDGATLAEPLVGTRVEALPPAATGVVLARLTFAAGARSDGLLSAGPTLLVVESGSVEIHIAHEGEIMRAGGKAGTGAGHAGTREGTGTEAVLGPGDGAIVPAAVRYSLHQDGADPAVVLGAALAFQDNGSDRGRTEHAERGVFEPIDSATLAPGSRPPDVRILLSEEVETWTPGAARIAIGRAILGPGAQVYPPTGETLFVAVESGALALNDGSGRTIAAGMGAMETPGPDLALRNAGAGLLVLLIVTVTPEAV